MTLQDEIDQKSATIYTEHLNMSIGELISMHANNELDLNPKFQRFFRWDIDQKSRFVESILLGVPLPSIFVYTRDDGVWEVIDGLQRLSTIFQLTGDLKTEGKSAITPLALNGTKHLPSLEGRTWSGSSSLDATQKLLFKRAKLDVKLMKRGSDNVGKYELFQRLNTGGSQLSEQEVRNCILVMENEPVYDWIVELSKNESFTDSLSLSDRMIQEQYDIELVVRFLVLRNVASSKLRVRDLGSYLTDGIQEYAEQSNKTSRARDKKAFESTFDALSQALGADAFRRYDSQKKRHMGGFYVSAFEALALGYGAHVSKDKTFSITDASIRKKAISMWSNSEFRAAARSGVTASDRIKKTIPFGRKLFSTT